MKAIALAALCVVASSCNTAESAERPASSTPASQGVAAAPAQQQASAANADAEALLAAADKARIQGDPNAKVWVVEISDFQCPYCKMWHDSTYPAIKREYIATGQVRMAYVNYPVAGHENAAPAAAAAMCAAVQDKFWVMHDALFDSQERWAHLPDASPVFEELAKKSGVKIDAWKDCLKGGLMDRLIAGDHQRGVTAGVAGTPSFFVGSEMIRGAAPAPDFRKAIERAKAKAAGAK